MYYLYILQSEKDSRTYTGYARNIKDRLQEHNKGKVKATRRRKPFKLIYFEECNTEKEAKAREVYWKSGAGRRNLKRIFRGFPPHFRNRKWGEARSK